MQENSNQKMLQEALRLAATPAGQQLLALLQQKGGSDLDRAMESASAGSYDDARQALEKLLSDPTARRLLDDLGR